MLKQFNITCFCGWTEVKLKHKTEVYEDLHAKGKIIEEKKLVLVCDYCKHEEEVDFDSEETEDHTKL